MPSKISRESELLDLLEITGIQTFFACEGVIDLSEVEARVRAGTVYVEGNINVFFKEVGDWQKFVGNSRFAMGDLVIDDLYLDGERIEKAPDK